MTKQQTTKQADAPEYIVEENTYNGTWDICMPADKESGEASPIRCGFANKEAADAALCTMDAYWDEQMAEVEAEEAAENEMFPNIAYVRSKIAAMKADTPKRLWARMDAADKLDWLMQRDKHQHIRWPLPSWKKIKSGRVY